MNRIRQFQRGNGGPAIADALPPHAPDAERAVLGTIIAEGKTYIDAANRITSSLWFYELRHQAVWEVLGKLSADGKTPDLVTVCEALRTTAKLDAIGGIDYLVKISGEVTSAANLMSWIDVLEEKVTARELLRISAGITREVREGLKPINEILTDTQTRVLTVRDDNTGTGEKTFAQIMPEVERVLDDFDQGRKVMAGYNTGFNYLDNVMAGFEPAQVYIIAARPSQGKTSLALDFSLWFGERHGAVLFFSLEMTKLQLCLRAVANEARINFQKFRNGFTFKPWMERLCGAAEKLNRLPFIVDDRSGLNGQQMMLQARRLIEHKGVKMLVLDYLQLMGSVQRWQQRREQVAEASEWCKRIARDLKVPFIVLAQLNREVEKEKRGREPQLADIAESGDIEQDGDFVGALYAVKMNDMISPKITLAEAQEQLRRIGKDEPARRDWHWIEHADSESPQDVELPWSEYMRRVNLRVLKQRNGPSEVNVELVFFKQQMRFADAGRPRKKAAQGELENRT